MKSYEFLSHHILNLDIDCYHFVITALASATVVFIECMSMAFAYDYEYDHNL